MINKKTLLTCCLLGVSFLLTSCDQTTSVDSTSEAESVLAIESQETMENLQNQRNLDPGSLESLEDVNEELATSGLNIRLLHAETVTVKEGETTKAGQTIYANDRQKRLTSQWVPGDERRAADENNLTYLVYEPYAPANWGTPEQLDGEPAIDASMDTWNAIKKNAKLDIIKVPDTGANPSYILGGDPYLADISEVGFMPPLYFELFVGPGTSSNVLGVTFTFIYTEEDGTPTDINNDGYADTALKEVWYNDGFLWTDEGNEGDAIDIETVALHENGHAIGFGHFGKVSVTEANNKLHVAPRAVMNAVILGTQRDLLGTDKAPYNSIYGSWPKN